MAQIPQGNYTALQRLRPITTDFGDIIDEGVDDLNAQAMRDMAEDEAEKKRKADLATKFGESYQSLYDVVTGTKSIDEAFARGINSARDLMGETYKDIELNPSSADTLDMQVKMSNLNNFAKNLDTISKRYTDYSANTIKGMQDGTLSGWNSGVLSDLDSIFSQANLDVKADKKTGEVIGVIAELDANGNPTGRLKELNLVEILDGRGLNNLVNRFDLQKSVQDIGTKLGQRETTVPGSGFKTITYQRFSDIEPEVRGMVRGFIGNPQNPTDVAKSIWADAMGEVPKDLTPEDMKRIEDYYVSSIKGFYDEKNKTTIDYSAQRGAAKDAEEKGMGITLRTDVTERPLREGLTGATGDIGGAAHSFTLPKTVNMGIKGQTRAIKELYLTDDGNIGYVETVYKGKKSGELINPEDFDSGNYSGEVITEDVLGGGFDKPQLNDIAYSLGFPNAGQLAKHLRGLAEQGTASPEAKKEADQIDTSTYNE